MNAGRVVPVGDSCLVVEFEEQIDPAVNARCIAFAEALKKRAAPGVRDIVPTYHTVAVYFDPATIAREALRRELARIDDAGAMAPPRDAAPLEIPVRYGGDAGPDLASVAMFGRCSEEDVIRLHTAIIYRVYMLGFLPGFAYLGIVDRRIAMPRLETPRMRVLAGSVGIAGSQTGVYPCDTPGGWRIIGQTFVKLFDASRIEPSLLKAGDRVKFVRA